MLQQDNKYKLTTNSKLDGLQMYNVKVLDHQTSEIKTEEKSMECLEDN